MRFRDMTKEDWITVGFIVFLAAVLVATGIYIHGEWVEEDRLMTQCMDDGHKEYECRAMLRKDDDAVIVMPVGVPR